MDKDLKDAIGYFEEMGFIEELTSDKRHYVEILIAHAKKDSEPKKVLEEQGFYTENLWCVEDVTTKYNCTDEEAQEVLDSALTNDATMNQIWFAIHFKASDMGLEDKDA